MRPDAIVKCIENYRGKTAQGDAIDLKKDDMFLKTTGPEFIYLNYYDNPAEQIPWLTPEEYDSFLGKYLEKSSDL